VRGVPCLSPLSELGRGEFVQLEVLRIEHEIDGAAGWFAGGAGNLHNRLEVIERNRAEIGVVAAVPRTPHDLRARFTTEVLPDRS